MVKFGEDVSENTKIRRGKNLIIKHEICKRSKSNKIILK